jgi:hypothetical protein
MLGGALTEAGRGGPDPDSGSARAWGRAHRRSAAAQPLALVPGLVVLRANTSTNSLPFGVR